MQKKALTTLEFIQRAKLIHGNKYDYSKVNYINNITNVCIICSIHGEFWQKPSKHINRHFGCKKCGVKKRSVARSLSIDTFIKQAHQIHNNRYDYSKVNYINIDIKICIICPEHGEFLQTPYNHIRRKQGCPKCNGGAILDGKYFIQRANQIHNNKYDYSKIEYKNGYTKICIICTEHKDFYQIPNSHLQGIGCPKCQRSKGEEQIESWLKENNIQFETQKRFKDCKNIKPLPFDFYLIKHNICIEYDGEQHYQSKKCFGGEHGFQRTQMNDNIKNNYCKQNNIKLIRIPYWESTKSFLDNVCSINVLSSNAPL
jgi:very-short-patch-repair endonuclease